MWIKNALVYTEAFRFEKKAVCIEDGVISAIADDATDETDCFDASGAYLVPGFINIHVHGALGHDFMEVGEKELEAVSNLFLESGTTAYLATTVTATYDDTVQAVKTISDYMKKPHNGAHVLGINIEGPYLNMNFKGAHAPHLLADFQQFPIDGVYEACDGNIKVITIAPEVNGAVEFVKNYKDKFKISLGHGGDDYDKCMEAFAAGATLVTHLFNTMPSIHHRNKGLIHAAFESGVYAELICDGIHVDKSVVLMAIKMFGVDKICLITDGIHATGLADGRYFFASAPYTVKDGVAKNDNGNLVGSTASMLQCLKNLVSWGVSLEDAVRLATANPADAIGISDKKGRISVGMDADLVLLDSALDVKKVWKK